MATELLFLMFINMYYILSVCITKLITILDSYLVTSLIINVYWVEARAVVLNPWPAGQKWPAAPW